MTPRVWSKGIGFDRKLLSSITSQSRCLHIRLRVKPTRPCIFFHTGHNSHSSRRQLIRMEVFDQGCCMSSFSSMLIVLVYMNEWAILSLELSLMNRLICLSSLQSDSPYKGGTFRFNLSLPPNFPFKAPTVRYHPHHCRDSFTHSTSHYLIFHVSMNRSRSRPRSIILGSMKKEQFVSQSLGMKCVFWSSMYITYIN